MTVIDDRKEWLRELTSAKTILSHDPADTVSGFDEATYFLSMTKGHASDVPFLMEVYRQFPDCPYVGVIGSDSKGRAIKKELKRVGGK